MSWKTYDYECECGIAEATVDYDERDDQHCATCDKPAQRLMCAPAIHTLETAMRGYDDSDGVWRPSHGGFVDQNIVIDGKPAIYNSPKEKQQCLDKAGLYQKDPTAIKRRKDKPKYFGNVGSSRKQQFHKD